MNPQEFDPYQQTAASGVTSTTANAPNASYSNNHHDGYDDDDDLVLIPPVDESSFRRYSSEPVSQNVVRTELPVVEDMTRSKSMIEEVTEEQDKVEEQEDKLEEQEEEVAGIEVEESEFKKEKERIKRLEKAKVETVSSQKVVTNEKGEEQPTEEISNAQEQSIRFAVTLLLCLMVPSATLTVMAAPKYAFLVFTMWIILGSLFIGFVWFVQYTVMGQNTKKRVIPFIHSVTDAIVQEYTRFKEEWMKEFLAIKNGSAQEEPTAEQQKEQQQHEQAPPKRRSVLFRVAVRPFLPLVRRRRRRRQQREDEAASSYTQTTPDGTVLV